MPECCQNGIILGYYVTLVDSSNASIANTVTTSDLFHSFHNLKKYHVYNLEIEAFTSKGAGPKAFTSATTDQDGKISHKSFLSIVSRKIRTQINSVAACNEKCAQNLIDVYTDVY